MLSPGSRLGPYIVLSHIGAGGMGQVWKARDTRLERIVAIKVSAAKFSDRFEREARAVAALNHPHICTLYDVGPDYLVMEYVEGSEIRGPLPLDQTLKLAIQLASAMEAAHNKGITHRDLKPSNILATKSGVKVLDFGLATRSQTKVAAANAETIARAPTQEGLIAGTLQYMAPEQVQGKETDWRADIFSFGCVLYEMLTGKRAFDGPNAASVIAAVLQRAAPSVAQLTPADLDWTLRRCLAKDRDERWQSASDLRAQLERIAQTTKEARETRPARLPKLAWGIAAVFATVSCALAFLYFGKKSPELVSTRFNILPPARTRFPDSGAVSAVSPDGSMVLFEALSPEGSSQLWLRPLDSLTARPLADTGDASFPFWSPDSKSIGFFASGKLMRMDIAGGSATALADAPLPIGGTWSRNGVIVFAPNPAVGLRQISSVGGVADPVTRGGARASNNRLFPWFLPDGDHFLYLSMDGRGRSSIRVGELGSSGDDRALLDDVDSAAVYAQGHLLFLRGNTLIARPFDPRRLVFTGEAEPLAAEARSNGVIPGLGGFSASANGVLVYQSGLNRVRLTWLDRAGKRLHTVGDAGALSGVSLSPNGRTAAVLGREGPSNNDIWLYDLMRGLRTRFTFDPATDDDPVWSPDGRMIVFASNRGGHFDIYRKPADGSTNEELVYADNMEKYPTSFSPDGRYLAYTTQDPKTGFDIWILPDPLGAGPGAKPRPFLRTEFNETLAQFSPDGRWIAYNSDLSGKFEVYVESFPGPGGKRQVSIDGGIRPLWRSDGREVLYAELGNGLGRLVGAEVDSRRGPLEVGRIAPLFGISSSSIDLSADGQRFLTLLPVEGETGGPLTVMQNWTKGLKK